MSINRDTSTMIEIPTSKVIGVYDLKLYVCSVYMISMYMYVYII